MRVLKHPLQILRVCFSVCLLEVWLTMYVGFKKRRSSVPIFRKHLQICGGHTRDLTQGESYLVSVCVFPHTLLNQPVPQECSWLSKKLTVGALLLNLQGLELGQHPSQPWRFIVHIPFRVCGAQCNMTGGWHSADLLFSAVWCKQKVIDDYYQTSVPSTTERSEMYWKTYQGA